MTYTTRLGQMWDEISHEVYGSSAYTDRLMQANTQFADVFIFPAGVVLNVPDLSDTDTDYTYVAPWRR